MLGAPKETRLAGGCVGVGCTGKVWESSQPGTGFDRHEQGVGYAREKSKGPICNLRQFNSATALRSTVYAGLP